VEYFAPHVEAVSRAGRSSLSTASQHDAFLLNRASKGTVLIKVLRGKIMFSYHESVILSSQLHKWWSQ